MHRGLLPVAAGSIAVTLSAATPPAVSPSAPAGTFPIHDIQGNGERSPFVGLQVATRGIITAVVAGRGFFIQTPDEETDADPTTSEGIFVYRIVGLPPGLSVGQLVEVIGWVGEYVPGSDPLQPPLTELTNPQVSNVIEPGKPLPAAIPLTLSFPDPAGAHDQLERFEGMRVSVDSLTVTGPTLGGLFEPAASATSSGVFFGVVTGVARPFREAGIREPDPAPAEAPRWNGNPEVLRVDSRRAAGGLIDAGAGTVVTDLTGPLTYESRRYTIMLEPGAASVTAGGQSPVPAPPPAADELTVATFNVERFFDAHDDPATADAVLTEPAYAGRLAKLSIAIRNYLHAPDIIAIQEVESLSVLGDIAARVNADSSPSPGYVPYLLEGNDPSGIDTGFLVRTSAVESGRERVSVASVTQEGKGATWVDPGDGSVRLLHDRPPLVLAAAVEFFGGRSFPITVVAVHLRSLTGVGDPRIDGATTTSTRVCEKRKLQAQAVANLVQARQVADPDERILVVGDFNAYELNDGYVDVLGTITGAPATDGETTVAGDGADLVDPDLVDLTAAVAPSERYSYVYDGNAELLDHILAGRALLPSSLARAAHVRIDADFPGSARNDTGTPLRISDHDPVIAYLAIDSDGDGVRDSGDNCPVTANSGQSDLDGDGFGDACDPAPSTPNRAPRRSRSPARPQP